MLPWNNLAGTLDYLMKSWADMNSATHTMPGASSLPTSVPSAGSSSLPESVTLRNDKAAVRIVDQRLLPQTLETIDLDNAQDMWDAIFQLKVRGAPAIGVAAAWCYYVLARQAAESAQNIQDLRSRLAENARFLDSSRPTAVNLSWALARMEAAADQFATLHAAASPSDIIPIIEAEAFTLRCLYSVL